MVETSGQPTVKPLNCLVTGASGYIGGRLVPELLRAGHRVRCLARSPGKLRDHPWAADVETVQGDVTDQGSVASAMRGIDVAYYLVHALGSGRGFEDTDRAAARTFAEQAHALGVRRIVYLGGLTPHDVPERSLSPAPALAGRGGTYLPRRACARHRAAGGRRHRLGLGVVRDAALSHRAASAHGHSQLGSHPDSADRRTGRAAVPGRFGIRAGRRRPGLRHPRAGRPDVPGDDAPLCRRRGAPTAAHRAGAGAHPKAVQSLGRPGHAGARRSAHGSAVLVGHVDGDTGALGEFAALYEVRPGDRVEVHTQRQVLCLAFYDDLTHAQIAERRPMVPICTTSSYDSLRTPMRPTA